MKPNIASITAILFLTVTLLAYWSNFGKRYGEHGMKPFILNCGFYILLLISILYSKEYFVAFKSIQASLLILFFPVVIHYFLPKIDKRTFQYFSYGFILSVFILLVYFFNLLVEGLAIDRFPGLLKKGIYEQFSTLNLYPYEFVLSKAQKHLKVLYEPHKVYLSLHFFVAILLSLNLLLKYKLLLIKKILLIVLIILFIMAIFYTQAITTVLTLLFSFFLFPFFYLKSYYLKVFYILSLIILGFLSLNSGFFKTYKNKNTASILKLFRTISENDFEDGVDKRVYIYSCSIRLIKDNPFLGYGVGDVQKELNECYDNNNYVVAEYESLGSDINSHNYYLHLYLSAGIITLLFLLWMFFHNLQASIAAENYIYTFFLVVFSVGLLTENILVRMSGVFLFSIVNSLFYSICTIDVRRDI